MIAVLLITHGHYGEDLLVSASHVLGHPLEQTAHLAISIKDDPEAMVDEARTLRKTIDDGSGLLIMTDMYGATPCNIATQLIADGNVEAVSGVSLPMLVRSLAYRESTLAKVRDKAIAGGTEGVVYINNDPCYGKR
jgi:PTS system mannose-specific IIA component